MEKVTPLRPGTARLLPTVELPSQPALSWRAGDDHHEDEWTESLRACGGEVTAWSGLGDRFDGILSDLAADTKPNLATRIDELADDLKAVDRDSAAIPLLLDAADELRLHDDDGCDCLRYSREYALAIVKEKIGFVVDTGTMAIFHAAAYGRPPDPGAAMLVNYSAYADFNLERLPRPVTQDWCQHADTPPIPAVWDAETVDLYIGDDVAELRFAANGWFQALSVWRLPENSGYLTDLLLDCQPQGSVLAPLLRLTPELAGIAVDLLRLSQQDSRSALATVNELAAIRDGALNPRVTHLAAELAQSWEGSVANLFASAAALSG